MHAVHRIPACRKHKKNIARFSVRFHLPRKNIIEIIIVADCRKDGGVRCERNRRMRATRNLIHRDEFRGEVLCVRGASSVSRNKYFPSVHEGRKRRIYDCIKSFRNLPIADNLLLEPYRLLKILLYHAIHNELWSSKSQRNY